tara:strand:- start:924 stop:1211 length:288 start_codon:yes stop_codon:yes gene_type:complete
MSLAFKPKIPESFKQLKKAVAVPVVMPASVGMRNYWSVEDLGLLANLRAMNVPLSECGKYLNRSINSCGGAVHKYDLYSTIANKREELIKVVLNG